MFTTTYSAATVLLGVQWSKGVKEARYAAVMQSGLIAGKWRQDNLVVGQVSYRSEGNILHLVLQVLRVDEYYEISYRQTTKKSVVFLSLYWKNKMEFGLWNIFLCLFYYSWSFLNGIALLQWNRYLEYIIMTMYYVSVSSDLHHSYILKGVKINLNSSSKQESLT